MFIIPNIDEIRLTTLCKREIEEQKIEVFYKKLKEKILSCAIKIIQNSAKQGKYNATVGYHNTLLPGIDFIDGLFTPKEHGLTKNLKDINVKPIWQECVEELKRNGYNASLDISTYPNIGQNMLPGEHEGYYIRISWE